MKGAEYIIDALVREGISHIFGYPGGAIMPVYDALVDSPIKHVLCRHEQGAALAADGYARTSGGPGVCLATSGPGATNLLTGLANAYMDSVPLIAITGQVASHLMGTDAFQEIDIFGMAMPVVKHSYVVTDVADLPHIMSNALHLATSGRPGPVLIDVPKDIQIAEFSPEPVAHKTDSLPLLSQDTLQQACQLLRKAKRPLLYIGGGVAIGKAEETIIDPLKTYC